ncbi:hypothetical protein T484DRAFT_1607822, partial [Baffinella frigidus]
PKTQNPKPKTQNPKPKTQNPKPKTQNPKPKTPNPKNPKPQTLNPKPGSQDYIEVYATVHEARNLPQSDTWGLCDAFCILGRWSHFVLFVVKTPGRVPGGTHQDVM